MAAATTVVPRYIHDSALNLHILATGFPAPAAAELVNYRLAAPPNSALRATVKGIALMLGGVALYVALNAIPYQAIFEWADSLYAGDAPAVAVHPTTKVAPAKRTIAQESAPVESAEVTTPLPVGQALLAAIPAPAPEAVVAAPSAPTAPVSITPAAVAKPVVVEKPHLPTRVAAGNIALPPPIAAIPVKQPIVVARKPAPVAKAVAVQSGAQLAGQGRVVAPRAQSATTPQVVRVVAPAGVASPGQPVYMVQSADGKSFTLAPPSAGTPVFVGGEAQPIAAQPAPIQRETILIK